MNLKMKIYVIFTLLANSKSSFPDLFLQLLLEYMQKSTKRKNHDKEKIKILFMNFIFS